jgi:hypothetical protein
VYRPTRAAFDFIDEIFKARADLGKAKGLSPHGQTTSQIDWPPDLRGALRISLLSLCEDGFYANQY